MTCVTEFIEFKDPDGHPLALSYGFEIDKGQKWGQRPLLPFPVRFHFRDPPDFNEGDHPIQRSEATKRF